MVELHQFEQLRVEFFRSQHGQLNNQVDKNVSGIQPDDLLGG